MDRSAAIRLLLVALLALCACQQPAAQRRPQAWIDEARLAAITPDEWLTGGRDAGKSHYSPLAQIDRASVARLGVAWDYRTGTSRGLEATPIVVDGVMYAAGVAGRVFALDAATGKPLWTFVPPVDMQVVRGTCCDLVNRGVAVWKGKVYVAAFDGWLYALDARTGAVVWKQDSFVDRKRGYSSTGAPEVAGDVVVIGNAGAEQDARGYVSAYDLQTGQLKWRFFTVPGPPDKPYEHPELAWAAKTWDPKSRWEFGGGGVAWDGMAYDPQLHLIYIGTGNAEVYPHRARSPSGGENLFVCSILAIDARTGRLAWHYQETPGDQWDYDAINPFILTTLKIGGADRRVLMQASKNGFFYVLDRKSGQVLAAHKFVQVNWARGVDLKTGRPDIDLAAADYSTAPKLVRPATVGAHNWHPMAFDPGTGLVYLAATESGNVLADASKELKYRPGLWNTGIQAAMLEYIRPGGEGLSEAMKAPLKGVTDFKMRTYLRAIDPVTGRMVWQQEAPGGWWDKGGVLATAGGLVFQGDGVGRLRVFDARNGALLKQLDVGSTIMAAPMTYALNGVQYVAVEAAWGGGGWGIAHPESAAYRYGNEGRIIAFKLDGAPPTLPPALPAPGPIPKPPAAVPSPVSVMWGESLFKRNCGVCHTNQTGSGAPDLRRMSEGAHKAFDDIVLKGALKAGGMPQWDDVLTQEDADAIHAYLISIAQQAWQAEQSGRAADPMSATMAKPG
jgi:quinohemoprotein ethanol dehydrogenase